MTIFYSQCPKCGQKTERDKNNKVTCTCGYEWFPVDLTMQAMAIQLNDQTTLLIQLQEVTNKLIDTAQRHENNFKYNDKRINIIIQKLEEKE